MRFNIVADPEPYAKIAEIIGVGRKEKDLFGKALAAVEAVTVLVRDLGLPSNLKALNVREEDIQELARTAVHHDRLVRGNIRKMSENDFVALLSSAL
jgi:alcohol dehydrogenase class IV